MAAGLSAIFLEHRAAIVRFLRARGAGEDADDLCQDIWLKLEARDIGPVADPLPYLYRMANNLMLDRYRSTSRRERREQDWAGGDPDNPAMAEASDAPAADAQMVARGDLARAQAVLAALGPRVDHILRRFRLDGVGQRAIAEELGVSLTTVEKDLQKAYRALAALRDDMDTE